MIKAGIIGGTGYTGIELIRLLLGHPQVIVTTITSRSEAGKELSDLVPNFVGHDHLVFSEPSVSLFADCDVVFFATPNGVAMKMAPELLAAGKRVIDLAADFRIKDQATWEQWYAQPHAAAELLASAVYGLPELNRELIRDAQLIANPGCYPTAVSLAYLPLLASGKINPHQLIADVKSGVSGAGRAASVAGLHAEVSENFKAYGVTGHRHHPEIEQTLQQMTTTGEVNLIFMPHLLPINRGIHATCYAQGYSAHQSDDLTQIYRQFYAEEPFVSVLEAGQHPETRAVRGTNQCIISVNRVSETQIIIMSVIDNLVKGAAGQAIQNMNIMYSLPEQMGLDAIGLLP